MRLRRLLSALTPLPLLVGCAISSVSMSSTQPGSRPVSARASVFNVLGLNPTSMEEITALRDSLSEQCEGGEVTGIVTISSTIYVIIGVVERTGVSGTCAEP